MGAKRFEDDEPPQDLRAQGLRRGLQSMIGAVAGVALGWYCGINIFAPLIGMAAAGAVFRKTVKLSEKTAYIPALTIQAGYLFWLVLGALVRPSPAVAVDIVVLAVGMAWLLIRPDWIPVAMLCVYHLAGLVTNAMSFIGMGSGDPAHRALIVHIIIRIAAILYLVSGYRRERRRAAMI